MKVCVIGKVPPFQGGTSSSTFEACLSLAGSGHQVDIVTLHPSEIPSGMRQNFWASDKEYIETLDGINVHFTEPLGGLRHFPFSEVYLSRLLGKVVEVCRSRTPDAIIGWYFEPFALAAALAGKLLDIPVFLRSAGSDLGRLSMHPNLAVAYGAAFEDCGVLCPPNDAVVKEWLRLGISEERLVRITTPPLPEYFRGRQKLEEKAPASIQSIWPKKSEYTLKPSRTGVFRLCIYGKIGRSKGTLPLLKAVKRLANDGFPIELFQICAGETEQVERYISTLNEMGLGNVLTVFGPISPWSIPDFIDVSDAVLFLENNFDIPFHSPRIIREVLARYKPLICTEEAVNGAGWMGGLVNKKNVMTIEGNDLANEIYDGVSFLVRSGEALAIGQRGGLLSKAVETALDANHSLGEVIISEL
jgi:hypothetical protein